MKFDAFKLEIVCRRMLREIVGGVIDTSKEHTKSLIGLEKEVK